jgi:hypothetical protein
LERQVEGLRITGLEAVKLAGRPFLTAKGEHNAFVLAQAQDIPYPHGMELVLIDRLAGLAV